MSTTKVKQLIPLLVLLVSIIVLLFLPVRSEELYGYGVKNDEFSNGISPDVYSSEVSQSLAATITFVIIGKNYLDAESRLDILRNSMVLIIPGLIYYVVRTKRTKRPGL